MTEFVLEILDGDRAGEIFELSTEPLTLGRRPGNAIVLKDEKCSGRHAEVVQEDGQWVLRDLDSTNGSLLDGRRITEVGLSVNDIFQVGITRVAFKEKGAPTPRNDLSVKKVDRAALVGKGRGGGIGLLAVVVLLLGAAAGWYFFLRGDAAGPVGSKVKAPRTVVGNMLRGGDFEAEDGGVFRTASGLGFNPDLGAVAAHTGRRYLLAVLGEEPSAHHALARSTVEMTASPGGGVTAAAFLMTTGNARAALRLRFLSTNPDQPRTMFTGSIPAKYDTYTEVKLELAVPEGCDRVEAELLALLPDADSTVSVDDVSVVPKTAAKVPHKIQTATGQRVTWSGGAMQIDDGKDTAFLGFRPETKDPALLALAREGLLGPSDVGLRLAAADDGGAVVVRLTRPDGAGGAGGIVLRFAEGIAASGVLATKGGAPFRNEGTKFSLADVDRLLFGYGAARFMVVLPQPGTAAGEVANRAFEIALPDPAEFRIVYDFRKQRAAARKQLAAARRNHAEGRAKDALDELATLLDTLPHDDSVAAQATRLRTRIRDAMGEEIRRFETQLDEAVYFGSLRGYRRIERGLAALVAKYGQDHLLQPEKVAAMRSKVASSIAAIEKQLGEAKRRKLAILAKIYGSSNKDLAALIEDYIKEDK